VKRYQQRVIEPTQQPAHFSSVSSIAHLLKERDFRLEHKRRHHPLSLCGFWMNTSCSDFELQAIAKGNLDLDRGLTGG